MKTEEVEALAKVWHEAMEKGAGERGVMMGLPIAGLEAVARAVRAQDAARGGEIPEVSLEAAARLVAEPGDWAPSVEFVGSLLAHAAAKGRAISVLTLERDSNKAGWDDAIRERDEARVTIAALEAAYAGLERTINADTDGKLALRKAHGARDNETFPAFVARLALERDDAHRLPATRVEASRLEAAESAHATLRQAVEPIRKAIDSDVDNVTPDEELCLTLGTEHVLTMGQARRLMGAIKATPAEHPDTATLRAIRERAKDTSTMAERMAGPDRWARMSEWGKDRYEDDARAGVAYLLGDSGPSGGGETRCRAGACHGGWSKPATRACGYCDDCCGHARGICAKPTTPPNVVTKWTRLADHPAGCECTECYTSEPTMAQHGWRTNPLGTTAFFLCGLRSCDTCAPYMTGTVNPPSDVAASEPKPTPEEDWRHIDAVLSWHLANPNETDASELRAAISALVRLKAEPRRTDEDAKDAALEEVAQNFEMLTAGGKISGLEAADAVRRRKAQPARHFVDVEEVRRASEAMRERCAATIDGRAKGAGETASGVLTAMASIIRALPL